MRTMHFVFLFVMLLFMSLSLCAEEPMDGKHTQDSIEGKKEKTWGIVPVPAIAYMPETSFLVSVMLNAYNNPNPDNPEQKIDNALIGGYYSLNNQIGIYISGDKYFSGNDYKLSLFSTASKFPSNFYGKGNNVNEDDKEGYDLSSFSINSSFSFEVLENFYIGPKLYYYNDTLDDKEDGKLLASGVVDGSEGVIQLGPGLVLSVDTRDSYSFPHEGFFYEAKWEIFSDKAGSDYSYNHLIVDLRNFFRIRGDHIIGINALYEMTTGSVPFQMLPRLGGDTIMRGFVDDKYRDKQYAAFQTEYRFPVVSRIGGSLFASAGNVVPGIEDFNIADIKTAGGFGLRVNLDKQQHINIRLDLAFNSDGEINFYLNLLEAF